ncbi:copper chaperone PCu(A)C [Pseudoclavibacter soli]|uniref:copper chaperone PCu(A)C n=1 Tax=Pseudoclavibacter soli TaxID=452623 RepID=UPI00042282C9|nr:copper chaperone PCu(A)C [Pseudoclavibacter soli]
MNNHKSITPARRVMAAVLLTAAFTLPLSACSSSPDQQSSDTASSSEQTQQDAVTVENAWAKAATTADGMTAVFGTLRATDGDVQLVSAETEVAGMTQLHETVDGKMQEKEGGFAITSDGFELAPGGNHIMLMKLKQDLEPGQTVTVTLHFSDGREQQFDAEVRSYTGANEQYGDDSEHEGMSNNG